MSCESLWIKTAVAFICPAGKLFNLYNELKNSFAYSIDLIYIDPDLPQPMILADITREGLSQFASLETDASRNAFASDYIKAKNELNDWRNTSNWLANIITKTEPELTGLQPLGDPQFHSSGDPGASTTSVMPRIPLTPTPQTPRTPSEEKTVADETAELNPDQLIAVVIEILSPGLEATPESTAPSDQLEMELNPQTNDETPSEPQVLP
jgi:hypothetical protein